MPPSSPMIVGIAVPTTDVSIADTNVPVITRIVPRTWRRRVITARSDGYVGGAEHAEVRGCLVGEELNTPGVAPQRAVEHEHLPVAVRLRVADEAGIEVEQLRQLVLSHDVDDPRVELPRRRVVAVRAVLVVRVPVVAARDERDALGVRLERV